MAQDARGVRVQREVGGAVTGCALALNGFWSSFKEEIEKKTRPAACLSMADLPRKPDLRRAATIDAPRRAFKMALGIKDVAAQQCLERSVSPVWPGLRPDGGARRRCN